jgi:metallo-beta-lactamase family protein
MTLSLTFHGGAETVTGSRFLVESGEQRALVDCGLFQGLKELRLLNWQEPAFDPRGLDAVLLTHAHIDHSGYLPRLARQGFRGPIYCTEATLELAKILLFDAAKLQEEDAAFANKKGFSKHHPALPLFDENDARQALDLMVPVQFDEVVRLREIRVCFRQAGHILGSAFLEMEASAGDRTERMVFSGDLGRVDQALHLDPDPLPECDTLVLESTYGDRLHERKPLADQIAGPFRKVLARGGTILIPAFAVARAQTVTLLLRQMMEDGRLPDVPVHIDSPMAVDVTSIYQRYLGTDELDTLPGGKGGLFPPGTRLHRSVQDSKALNDMKGPRIIVSASGMLTGGRVLHHLQRLLPDKRNMVVLVGYQPVGTRGRALMDGARVVRMHGYDVPANAEVLVVNGFSAHADREGLLDWVASAAAPPRDVFLVHGEPGALQELSGELTKRGLRVTVPKRGERFVAGHRGGWRLDDGGRPKRGVGQG